MSNVNYLFPLPLYKSQVNTQQFSVLSNAAEYFTEQSREHFLNGLNIHNGQSNTGWHSEFYRISDETPSQINDLFHIASTHLREFIKQIIRNDERAIGFGDFDLSLETHEMGWAIINLPGDVAFSHIHTTIYRDTYACVLYLQVPDGCKGGELRLANPDIGFRSSIGTTMAQLGLCTTYRKIKPETGNILIFPGTLPHDVLPFEAKGHRIAFACNFGIKSMSLSYLKDGCSICKQIY